MEFVTIQDVAKLLKCTPRSVYRKIEAIDSFDNLVIKGFAQREVSTNGNSSRLFSKEWITETFVVKDKVRQSKIGTLDTSAFEILKEQLTIKDNQIDLLSENLNLALNRIAELQKYFHLNGLENGPTLTPTRKYLEEHPESSLNYNVGETEIEEKEAASSEDNPAEEKSITDWLKSFR